MSIAWFGMCLAFTVSDLIVPKKACGLGIILAFVFTAVFFVWQNHTRKDLLWKCFKDAVKICFWIMAVIAFLFRPLYEGGRYAGIFTNPNTFALYLYIIFCVYMSDMDWMVETGRNWKKNATTYISLALVVFYLSLTQARTSMIAVGTVFAMWIVLRLCIGKRNHKFRSFLKNTIFLLLFCVILYPLFYKGLEYIPAWVDDPIVFDGEALYMANGGKIQDLGEVVVAEPDVVPKVNPKSDPASKENGPIGEDIGEKQSIVPENVWDRFFYVLENTKGLNALTSGRIDIYKAYMSKLNYSGHRSVSLVTGG